MLPCVGVTFLGEEQPRRSQAASRNYSIRHIIKTPVSFEIKTEPPELAEDQFCAVSLFEAFVIIIVDWAFVGGWDSPFWKP